MRKYAPLLLLLLAYLFVATLYAIYTPDWQAPDEPAHYNYIRQLATGHLPVMAPGDYDQDYIFEVIFVSHFAPPYSIDSLQYEDWQPPLYYLLQTPVYWLWGGSLLALRLFSVLLGAGVVALAYGVARKLFPGHEWMALTTAVLVAFLPQHMAIMASVNNDSLAELLIGAILWALIGWARRDTGTAASPHPRVPASLGLFLGLGFLAKGTVYSMALIVGLVLLWRFRGDWRGLARAGLQVFVPALLLGALWWGRNMVVYGGFDVLGKAAHDAVVVGQPRTAEWIAQKGTAETVRLFFQTTFNSFWGQFGWMTVPMPAWVYRPLWLFCAMVLAGLLTGLVDRRRPAANHSPIPNLILTGLFLLTLAMYVGYNLTFVQHQGRYLFPALIPIGAGVAVGSGIWARPFARRWPYVYSFIPLALALALAGLDLWALFRVIEPALSS